MHVNYERSKCMCICRGADSDNYGACVADDSELLQSAGNEFYHLDSADDLTTRTSFQLCKLS